MTQAWYGVKTLYRRDTSPGAPKEGDVSAIEERIVVLTAESLDDAIARGELEARQYTASVTWPNDAGQTVTCRYLDAINVYAIYDELVSGTEVFSQLLYVSVEEPDESLIDRMFGTEQEEGVEVRGAFEPDFGKGIA